MAATAWDYFDFDLRALKPVKRYTSTLPGGAYVDTVGTSSIVGKIYSYVVDDEGAVWWQLYESWKPGFSMFVKHDPVALEAIAPTGAVVKVEVPGMLTDLSQSLSSGVVGDVSNIIKWGVIGFLAFKAVQLFKK